MDIDRAVRWSDDEAGVRIVDQRLLPERYLERDLRTLEAAAGHLEDKAPQAAPASSAFDVSIGTLRSSLADANRSLDELRAKLDAAG